MRIIVLNDGETYTGADGCLLLDIDLEGYEDTAEILDDELKSVCTEFLLDTNRVNAPMNVDYKGGDIVVDVYVVARFK